MVYDWDGKEEVCYRMYIEEKRPLEDIMEFLKEQHNFAPSKRAFQTQFKRWEFPSKQNPAHRNGPLVERVKELWETNTGQKEMLRILLEEGFEIKERELMRVRAKNRWLLRVPNGMKQQSLNGAISTGPPSRLPTTPGANVQPELDPALFVQETEQTHPDTPMDIDSATNNESPDLSPEVLAKRKERLEKLQAESAERWAAKKRRRRTRGWAGLPADPPGPPRFPSETTIDESKAYLNLDDKLYREVRDHFQKICEEEGIIKKTLAGPEKWQAAKDRLVQESPHLRGIMFANPSSLDQKTLSLDVVCMDVTKRMRTLERRMTIAEAKNALQVNPEESRQVRNSFYQILKADHFTSKLEAGDEHWKELKAQWIQQSDLLRSILEQGEADPNHELKVKALEVLCRDVMKRLRDDQTKRDPSRKKQQAAKRLKQDNSMAIPDPFQTQHDNMPPTTAQTQSMQSMAQQVQNDLQIDPSLLLAAANDPSIALSQHPQASFLAQMASFANAAAPATIPVYFRLSADSHVQHPVRIWLGTLTSTSVSELRRLALSKHPNAMVERVEGIVKEPNGNEVVFGLDEDDELEAYLAHIQGGKAAFVAHLREEF